MARLIAVSKSRHMNPGDAFARLSAPFRESFRAEAQTIEPTIQLAALLLIEERQYSAAMDYVIILAYKSQMHLPAACRIQTVQQDMASADLRLAGGVAELKPIVCIAGLAPN